MQIIPIQPLPYQIITTTLDGQNIQLGIYQKVQGLFVDVNLNGQDIAVGVIAQNNNPLAINSYNGLQGNLLFTDMLGSTDPQYQGLGSQYILVYLSAQEYADFV